MNLIEMLLWSSIVLLALFYFSYYLLMVNETKKPSKIRKQKIFPKVSFVVPTYNEGRTILRKLENIEDLDYPKEKLEVLVVDSGSSDDTRQLVANFMQQSQGKLDLQLITQHERMGKASALNYAWQYCRGDFVIVSDADAVFEKNAVTTLVQNFSNPVIGAVTGRLFIVNADQSSATRMEKSYRSIFEILRVGESNMDSTPIFNGPIAIFRRELLDKLEPDTVADDTELSIRIREKGWKTIYDPEAVAYEYTPTKLTSRVKQKARRGQGIIQSFIRHKGILFNSKYGKYGLVIFPCEFFMHIISPLLVFLVIALSLITVVIQPVVLTSLLLIIALLLIASGLILLFQRATSPNKKKGINPIAILETFLNHQLCLILSLCFLFMRRASYRWGKIEDVRTLEAKKALVSETIRSNLPQG